MNFLESLAQLKQKMSVPPVLEQAEPLSDPAVEPDSENPSIDILSWIDSHGFESKETEVYARSAKQSLPYGDFQEKLLARKSRKRIEVEKFPVQKEVLERTEYQAEQSGTETTENVHDLWFEEPNQWDLTMEPEHWFQKSIEEITEESIEEEKCTNDSFEDSGFSESDSSAIVDHLNQHGIALKSVDFDKKKVRGEEGVHRSKGAVEKTVDLHGMHVRDAELKLIRTFDESKVRGYQQILIIHGKGNHSSGGDSKMKRMVMDLLEGSLAEKVSSFTFAPYTEGGGGATRVVLK